MIAPSSISELSDALRDDAGVEGPVGNISLAGLNRVIRHAPQDLTVTVESGMTLGALQKRLAESGQWLPLDPPDAGSITIRELLDRDRSGPRRFGFGTARDWVIGLRAVLPDGRVIESGGGVVKNVAGYEIHKLLIGARGELAVIAEAAFKVNPVPECEEFFSADCPDPSVTQQLLTELLTGAVNPHVVDLHNVHTRTLQLVVGFCGSAREVEWQRDRLPASVKWHSTDLRHADLFAEEHDARDVQSVSVRPSELSGFVDTLLNQCFVARAGNGIVYSLFPNMPPRVSGAIETRVQHLFDPRRRLVAPTSN